jgi:hypothetical protein
MREADREGEVVPSSNSAAKYLSENRRVSYVSVHMKRISMVVGIGIAGLAGYLLEPVLVSRAPEAISSSEEAATDEPTSPQEALEEPAPEIVIPPADPAGFDPFVSPAPDTEPDPSPFDLPPIENPSPEPPPAEPEPAAPAEEPVPEEPKVEEGKVEETNVEEVETPILTDAEEIVTLMKASFSSGTVKEFASGKPKAWKATDPETIDGIVYQTGLVSYEADTILGRQTTLAKALIRNGAVVKWVSAKTGMELK